MNTANEIPNVLTWVCMEKVSVISKLSHLIMHKLQHK